MPLEEIACTRCGSTDVQEVKPSTYFCNHCETVFKHFDPTRLTVENAPAFCSCGNPIKFQCQLCKTGICLACDVIAWRRDYDQSRYEGIISAIPITPSTSKIYVPVQGYGYTGNARKYGNSSDSKTYELLSVSGRHVVRSSYKSDDRFGPWLPVDKLLAVLAGKRVRLGHACWPCIGNAVPEVAERIATGAICETPDCTNKPKQACSCCGSAFCESCLTPNVSALWANGWAKEGMTVITISAPESWGDSKDYRVEWQPADGLCVLCGHERAAQIWAWQRTAYQELANVLEPGSNNDERLAAQDYLRFWVPTARRRTHAGRRAECERAQGVAERCAAELTERLKKFSMPTGGCQRDSAYAERRWYAWYAITDNRKQQAPALAPEVTKTD